MRVVVIDGQGGRLGAKLTARILSEWPSCDLMAIGTNSIATQTMLKAGAKQAATGENALIVSCRNADVLLGPLGIAMADSLMGEISPAMATAVSGSAAHRILIPMNLCDTYVAGISGSSGAIIEDAMAHLKGILGKN